MTARHARGQSGFTLVETLIALGLLAAVSAGIAHLFAITLRAGAAARESTLMTVLAASRLEQLLSLDWCMAVGAAPPAVPRSDVTTDLSRDPAGPGGPGLAEAPAGALDADTAGWVDYLDRHGRWAGTVPGVPRSAVYVRRWAVRHLPGPPDDVLALQVLVSPLHAEQVRTPGGPRRWTGEDVLLTTFVVRRAR
jgi:prepilin-type N-terminal cleavage/methylation domain-containing protein